MYPLFSSTLIGLSAEKSAWQDSMCSAARSRYKDLLIVGLVLRLMLHGQSTGECIKVFSVAGQVSGVCPPSRH